MSHFCWEVWGIAAGRIGVRSLGRCAGFTAEADLRSKSGQNFKGSLLRFRFLRRKQQPTSQQTNKQTNRQTNKQKQQNKQTNKQTNKQQNNNTTKTERKKKKNTRKQTNKQTKIHDLLYDFKDLFQ